jgi:hypothetical protein
MQAQQTRKAPLGVIFDTSLEGEIDQVLSLAMLFGFEGTRQIRVPSLSSSRFNLRTARFLDLISRFFGGEQAGDFVVNRIPLPIGRRARRARTCRRCSMPCSSRTAPTASRFTYVRWAPSTTPPTRRR